jgi:hypothetical protein
MAHDALQNVDALFGGTGVPLPSTVILDYIYGSKHGDGFDEMKAYRNEHYAHIPPLPPSSPDVTSGPDYPDDAGYKPSKPRKHYPSTRRGGLEETMDELNMVLMYIQGITPEMAAERNQKEIGAGRAGSSGSEPKQSDGVEGSYGCLLKCIHNCCLPIILCALCLLNGFSFFGPGIHLRPASNSLKQQGQQTCTGTCTLSMHVHDDRMLSMCSRHVHGMPGMVGKHVHARSPCMLST